MSVHFLYVGTGEYNERRAVSLRQLSRVLLSETLTSSRSVFVQGAELGGTYSPVYVSVYTCDCYCQSVWPFVSRAAAGTAVAMAAVTFLAVVTVWRILEILVR